MCVCVVAKIYSSLNDRLYVELYPNANLSTSIEYESNLVALQDQEVDVKFSLNELLVAKKFAEFKLETELYEYDYHHNWIGNFQQHFVWSPDYEFPSAFNEDPSDLNELQLEVCIVVITFYHSFY